MTNEQNDRLERLEKLHELLEEVVDLLDYFGFVDGPKSDFNQTASNFWEDAQGMLGWADDELDDLYRTRYEEENTTSLQLQCDSY